MRQFNIINKYKIILTPSHIYQYINFKINDMNSLCTFYVHCFNLFLFFLFLFYHDLIIFDDISIFNLDVQVLLILTLLVRINFFSNHGNVIMIIMMDLKYIQQFFIDKGDRKCMLFLFPFYSFCL